DAQLEASALLFRFDVQTARPDAGSLTTQWGAELLLGSRERPRDPGPEALRDARSPVAPGGFGYRTPGEKAQERHEQREIDTKVLVHGASRTSRTSGALPSFLAIGSILRPERVPLGAPA